jgi:hypothetical protein
MPLRLPEQQKRRSRSRIIHRHELLLFENMYVTPFGTVDGI